MGINRFYVPPLHEYSMWFEASCASATPQSDGATTAFDNVYQVAHHGMLTTGGVSKGDAHKKSDVPGSCETGGAFVRSAEQPV